ncbi:Ca-activated chloride channel family protein [Kordia periserrulae]|uniref:Ca-activated chloride channel family protein n=1 Tax=Kordia periserrulae TaxID=701523 RepID=A0A2T6BX22_9FLAO|nr:VWA domain-containing protein [Kordia periserrulae]PTX60635.1 Ca-activated chloride channel family protein [Kordia periserrulae]
MIDNYTFAHPQFFWLLLFIPVAIAWYVWKKPKQLADVKMSSLKGFKATQSILPKLKPILFALRMLAVAALIIALARPQTKEVSTRIKTNKGIDIVMAIDVSASMLSRDLKPNRLAALKRVASEFIEGRPSDRIGLVVYAGESFTKTPITTDKSIIQNALKDITYKHGELTGGTAIGMGLATAVNRLKDSKAKSKVIILLTDGENNAGFIEPQIAAELAAEYGIKTYTIGIGTNGMASTPVAINPDGTFLFRNMQVKIDEALLQQIAKTTGGKYFRATNSKKLEGIYEEINKLEKTEIEEFRYTNYEEKFRIFVFFAGILLLLEILLRNTLFRSFI